MYSTHSIFLIAIAIAIALQQSVRRTNYFKFDRMYSIQSLKLLGKTFLWMFKWNFSGCDDEAHKIPKTDVFSLNLDMCV